MWLKKPLISVLLSIIDTKTFISYQIWCCTTEGKIRCFPIWWRCSDQVLGPGVEKSFLTADFHYFTSGGEWLQLAFITRAGAASAFPEVGRKVQSKQVKPFRTAVNSSGGKVSSNGSRHVQWWPLITDYSADWSQLECGRPEHPIYLYFI